LFHQTFKKLYCVLTFCLKQVIWQSINTTNLNNKKYEILNIFIKNNFALTYKLNTKKNQMNYLHGDTK